MGRKPSAWCASRCRAGTPRSKPDTNSSSTCCTTLATSASPIATEARVTEWTRLSAMGCVDDGKLGGAKLTSTCILNREQRLARIAQLE